MIRQRVLTFETFGNKFQKPELHGDEQLVLEDFSIALASEISIGKHKGLPLHHIHHELFATAAK